MIDLRYSGRQEGTVQERFIARDMPHLMTIVAWGVVHSLTIFKVGEGQEWLLAEQVGSLRLV